MYLDTNTAANEIKYTVNEMKKVVVKDSEGNYFHSLGLIVETRGALPSLNGSHLECKLATLLSERTLTGSLSDPRKQEDGL
jgi:hypothetical protein